MIFWRTILVGLLLVTMTLWNYPAVALTSVASPVDPSHDPSRSLETKLDLPADPPMLVTQPQTILTFPEMQKTYAPAKPAGGVRRVEAPLNERLQLKYTRKIEIERRFYRIIGFHLRPGIEFDDNVSRGAAGEKESHLIFTGRAGITVNLLRITGPRFTEFFTRGGFNLGITYLVDYVSFSSDKGSSDFDQVISPNIQLPGLDIDIPFLNQVFGRKSRITISDDLHPEQYVTEIFNDRERRFRIVNDFGASITYPLARKTFVSLPYANHYTRYLDSEFKEFNSISQSLSPTLSFVPTPKTSFFGGAVFSLTHFQEEGNNFRDFILQAGISKEITAKVNLGLSGGYQVRTLDETDETIGGPHINFFYNHRISRWTQFNFTASQAIEDTLSGRNTLGGTRGFEESAEEGNPSVKRTSLNARISHELTHRISLHGGVQVFRESGEDSDGTDFLYRLDAGLSYLIRRGISLNLAYIFTSRSSGGTDDDSDSKDNRIVLSLNFNRPGGEALVNIERGGRAFLER